MLSMHDIKKSTWWRFFFDDGKRGVVDLSKYPDKGGVFAPLSDIDYFKRFFVDLNTLCWPNGADIAPERLYEQLTD